MACGIGVCMTCVLPVVGDDGRTRFARSCVEGPVFGGDRVRFADVGTLPGTSSAPTRWEWSRRDRRSRAVWPTGHRRSTCRHRWAARRSPSPVLTASGCSAFGRELEPFVDLDRDRRRGHQVGAAAAALGPADPADGRDAERDAQLDRPAGPGHRRPARRRPALAGRARRPRLRLDRRHPRRGLRRARRRGCAACPACSGSRSTSAARTWRAAARCSPATRWPPPTSSPPSGRPPTRRTRSTPSSAPTSPTS